MSSSYILATGTAVPPNVMSQSAALEMFQDLACVDDRQRRLAKVLFDRAKVKKRFTFVPHQSAYRWCSDPPPGVHQVAHGGPLTTAPDPIPVVVPGSSPGLSTGLRMRLYDLYAADIAIESATQAIQSSGVAPSEITHLVTVSCTGFASPGVDVRLIKSLGLPATTQRVNIGFMGCHGAVNGVRAATSVALADPAATVLVCCVELCSLHCRFQWGKDDNEKIIGNALFGDGSASLIVSSNQRHHQDNWEIVHTGSVLIEGSESELRWDIGDHGFEMILNSDIGGRIESALADWLSQWLSDLGLGFDAIDCWAVHPGGPKIISAVQESLKLTDQQLATSMDVLNRYGNMSSPTVLFILEEFRKNLQSASADAVTSEQANGPRYALMIAFGPGMVAEVALLKRNA